MHPMYVCGCVSIGARVCVCVHGGVRLIEVVRVKMIPSGDKAGGEDG